jgi:hypothetical protein
VGQLNERKLQSFIGKMLGDLGGAAKLSSENWHELCMRQGRAQARLRANSSSRGSQGDVIPNDRDERAAIRNCAWRVNRQTTGDISRTRST